KIAAPVAIAPRPQPGCPSSYLSPLVAASATGSFASGLVVAGDASPVGRACVVEVAGAVEGVGDGDGRVVTGLGGGDALRATTGSGAGPTAAAASTRPWQPTPHEMGRAV